MASRPEGIEDAFAAIIDGVADDRLRAYLYHIPQVSGVAIPTGVAANLRKRYGKVVAGLKDSSGDFKQFQAFRAAAPELAITVGNEVDITRAIAAGGAGTICGMANIVPELVKAMIDGKDVEARMQAAVDIVVNITILPHDAEGHPRRTDGRRGLAARAAAAPCLVRRHRAQAKARRADCSRHRVRSRKLRDTLPRIRALRVAIAAHVNRGLPISAIEALEPFNTRAIQARLRFSSLPPTVRRASFCV